jgi:hypothetical protein
MKAVYLILIGGALAITGVILPLLMVIKVLPSTFFLAFFSHGASVSGVFLGIIGAAMVVRDRK